MVRVVLGLLLLSAAGLKVHQLATVPVVGDGLLDNRWLLMAEVELELAFGLWLLAGLAPKWTWRAAVLCFAGFACITLYKALLGETTCGCFGRVEVNPWYTLVLDLAAVAALLRWRPRVWGLPRFPHSEDGTVPFGPRSPRFSLVAVAILWLVVGLPAAWAMANYQAATVDPSGGVILGEGHFVVLEPEQWIGKPFPLLDYIDIGDQLAKGEWIVVLYHYDCPKCQDVLAEYGRTASLSDGDPGEVRIALVEMPPYSDRRGISRGRVHWARLDRAKEWFASTPVELSLNAGTVVEVLTSERSGVAGSSWDRTSDPRLPTTAGRGRCISTAGGRFVFLEAAAPAVDQASWGHSGNGNPLERGWEGIHPT